MNSGYEKSLDENFNKAITLCYGEFSRAELFRLLEFGSMSEKHFAALEIDTVKSQEEAKILISNLTGCDGKIREAVAFKLREIMEECKVYFSNYPDIFADATIDINANICRMVIECLYYLKEDKEFSNKYLERIKDFIQEALDKLDSFIFRDKKYTINKQLFKLYWCLEGLNVFFKDVEETEFTDILSRCSNVSEYTIREKVALVLKHDIHSQELLELRNILKLDSNYYVKNT